MRVVVIYGWGNCYGVEGGGRDLDEVEGEGMY